MALLKDDQKENFVLGQIADKAGIGGQSWFLIFESDRWPRQINNTCNINSKSYKGGIPWQSK